MAQSGVAYMHRADLQGTAALATVAMFLAVAFGLSTLITPAITRSCSEREARTKETETPRTPAGTCGLTRTPPAPAVRHFLQTFAPTTPTERRRNSCRPILEPSTQPAIAMPRLKMNRVDANRGTTLEDRTAAKPALSWPREAGR